MYLNKFKIFNDPIYGFIHIPSELIFDIIEHPYFQRLRRISQMGLSYYVYPGAHHTRFEHALGAMHLMEKVVEVLRRKKIDISKTEEEALLVAILLHDIGHGPFSHTLEHSIVSDIRHEEISLRFMQELNTLFDGKLNLAIEMFKGEYPRKFFSLLISSQLDIDRLDYLKRDSFYTGVTEGNINVDRIISMLNVVDDRIVVEAKGIYSIEKFIVARRLMYWMVYLHKTGLVADHLLVKIFERAQALFRHNELECSSPGLTYLLTRPHASFTHETLVQFATIDDVDVIMAIKEWTKSEDHVLATLCKALLGRKFPKIRISNEPFDQAYLNELKAKYSDAQQFIFQGEITHRAYNAKKQPIEILYKNGMIKELSSSSEHLNLLTLTQPVVKYFVTSPKE
ncbi:HD domain-containing protein [Flavobacteriaceae bacterium F08102]|nr:HD domain-containing protein [Flavobacteriaceae bacterium F08102]